MTFSMLNVSNTRLVCTARRTLKVSICDFQLKFSFCVWTRLTSFEGLKSHFWKSYMQSKTSIFSIKEESWRRVCVPAKLCFLCCKYILCFQSFEPFHPIAVLHFQKDLTALFYFKVFLSFSVGSCPQDLLSVRFKKFKIPLKIFDSWLLPKEIESNKRFQSPARIVCSNENLSYISSRWVDNLFNGSSFSTRWKTKLWTWI